MGERKEYYTKNDFKDKTGYTLKEAEKKRQAVIDALMTVNRTAYTNVKIEPDPRGGYRVAATYKTGIHHYDENGDIEYTTPTDHDRDY